jgi:hypothetical protein
MLPFLPTDLFLDDAPFLGNGGTTMVVVVIVGNAVIVGEKVFVGEAVGDEVTVLDGGDVVVGANVVVGCKVAIFEILPFLAAAAVAFFDLAPAASLAPTAASLLLFFGAFAFGAANLVGEEDGDVVVVDGAETVTLVVLLLLVNDGGLEGAAVLDGARVELEIVGACVVLPSVADTVALAVVWLRTTGDAVVFTDNDDGLATGDDAIIVV